MWWFPFCLALTGALGAQAPLRILAVERRGPPPYEAADRIYVLDGGEERGLRVGDRLSVKRAGLVRAIGHLRVTVAKPQGAEARFEPAESTYPMKGDLVLKEEAKAPPEPPRLDTEPLPRLAAPLRPGAAPPREGLIFFLPQRADLSPAGLRKLEAWVAEWGSGGRWAVQVPAAKALKPGLQKERGESLRAALMTLGIAQVGLEAEPRGAEGKYDPAWIRHWD